MGEFQKTHNSNLVKGCLLPPSNNGASLSGTNESLPPSMVKKVIPPINPDTELQEPQSVSKKCCNSSPKNWINNLKRKLGSLEIPQKHFIRKETSFNKVWTALLRSELSEHALLRSKRSTPTFEH